MIFVPTSLDELAEWLGRAPTSYELFGDDLERQYRLLARLCHPDLFPRPSDRAKAAKVFRRLTELRDAATGAVCPRTMVSPSRTYQVLKRLAAGDLCDVLLAEAGGRRYVVKIARPVAARPLLASEARHLATLARRAGDRHYREYLPGFVESFAVTDCNGTRQANVFLHRDGFYTLEEIRRRHPAGLDARHLAWIFKRMLAIVGLVRTCGLVHAAILPPHVMLHAENHGLQLLDWIHAVRNGSVLSLVPTAFRDWYPSEVFRHDPVGPATDIFMAAKCLVYLAGGDPVAGRWPQAVPWEMQRFVDSCLFASPRMRPQDAWDLHDEFDGLLLRLFGPAKYHRLVMS